MDNGQTLRKHERKLYKADVIFNVHNRPYNDTLKDISMGGAFVMTPSVNQVRKGDTVTITVPYTNGQQHIQRGGHVQRKSRTGFAVKFY